MCPSKPCALAQSCNTKCAGSCLSLACPSSLTGKDQTDVSKHHCVTHLLACIEIPLTLHPTMVHTCAPSLSVYLHLNDCCCLSHREKAIHPPCGSSITALQTHMVNNTITKLTWTLAGLHSLLCVLTVVILMGAMWTATLNSLC